MKYSINGTGFIVAERDIYSLGGFIPKGTVGGKIASEAQLSQDGECWLAGGDISGRPDIVIKDNAYVGNFVGATGMHTDGVTEFSGNTLIPGKIIVRNPIADPINNFYAKDSFIGVSMDVLCGPRNTTTAFPFEQGGYVSTAPRGTAFSSVVMQTGDVNLCRSTDSVIRCGLNTYVYLPTGYSGRILWAYTEGGTAVYSGESKVIPSGLTKIEHPVYKRFMLHITKINGTAMTPANLLATGAKILGHINSSANVDIRPESASGSYVMDKSSFLLNTDNFGLNTTQLRFLAGGMYDTTMYTKTDRQDYKPYGTFRNVERLEYTKYLGDLHRTAATRDTYISAYDCPLLRVDDDTYDTSLMGTGDLVLRRCIVPKGRFAADPINGNTYEDLDFSYVNEFMGRSAGNRTLVCSHRQGLYSLYAASGSLTGLVSYPENTENATSITEELVNIPLDGDIIEQGTYAASIGQFYEEGKGHTAIRVRTGKPVSTWGLVLPVMPSGYVLSAAHYLDNEFKFANSVAYPQSIDENYPFVVFVVNKDPAAAVISASEFIALNISLTVKDYTKVPEITGSAYVGAGCTVRGDVQLHGDPYVNRVFDVNMWERGSGATTTGGTWEATKAPEVTGYPRLRTRDVFPVDAAVDNNFTCASGYEILIYYFGEDGKCSGYSPWGTSLRVSDPLVVYISIIVRDISGTKFIDSSDIPLANVKYLRAFKKRRYITNELDRNSSEDILMGPDYWEQGGISIAEGNAGKPYEELKIGSPYRIRLKRPFGLGAGYRVTFSSVYSFGTSYYDAVTKLLYGSTSANMGNSLLSLVGNIADSPTAAITPADVTAARLVIEFTPTPRIIAPYGSDSLFIRGSKIRMYDNAVLSRNLNQEGEIVLQGDAVMGYDFNSGSCMCSNGHSDAIIKLP